jgi:hypothetical protein
MDAGGSDSRNAGVSLQGISSPEYEMVCAGISKATGEVAGVGCVPADT